MLVGLLRWTLSKWGPLLLLGFRLPVRLLLVLTPGIHWRSTLLLLLLEVWLCHGLALLASLALLARVFDHHGTGILSSLLLILACTSIFDLSHLLHVLVVFIVVITVCDLTEFSVTPDTVFH